MICPYNDVLVFHRKFGCAIGRWPGFPDFKTAALRMSLINEERDELQEAIEARNLPKVADALADLLYVVYGTAVTFGIDIRPVWDEVHASNMRKEGGATREDGKILKPPGWVGPDIETVLRAQGWDGGRA